MSASRPSEPVGHSRAVDSRYPIVTPTASSLYRLAHAGLALIVCAVAIASVIVAVMQVTHVEGTRSRPAPAIDIAVMSTPVDDVLATPRAADLVLARKNVDRAPLLATAELEASIASTTAPGSMIAGTAASVEVSVTNTGLASWPATGEQAVRLSYHWFASDGSTAQWDGTRAVLKHDVAPGETATLVVDLHAPASDGSYVLAWDMVKEGAGWFAGNSTAMKTQQVAVSDGVTAEDLRAVARHAAVSAGLDPDIFERQIHAESGFDPHAHSPAGARGIAQITPATARSWGVDTSDPVASLQVAAQQMAKYVKKYGNYSLALAAYNAGPGAVERYGGVPPYAETQHYIAKILGGG
jgi:hypothetical protein